MAMTAAVKDELSRVDVPKPCCRRAEMAALLRFAGGLHIVSGRVVVEAELDTGAVARRLRREIADVSVRQPPGQAAGSEPAETAEAPPGLLARTERVFAPALEAVADLHRIEDVLTGALASDQAFRAAAAAALRDPFTVDGTAFKVELAKRTIVRVLQDLAGAQP